MIQYKTMVARWAMSGITRGKELDLDEVNNILSCMGDDDWHLVSTAPHPVDPYYCILFFEKVVTK